MAIHDRALHRSPQLAELEALLKTPAADLEAELAQMQTDLADAQVCSEPRTATAQAAHDELLKSLIATDDRSRLRV